MNNTPLDQTAKRAFFETVGVSEREIQILVDGSIHALKKMKELFKAAISRHRKCLTHLAAIRLTLDTSDAPELPKWYEQVEARQSRIDQLLEGGLISDLLEQTVGHSVRKPDRIVAEIVEKAENELVEGIRLREEALDAMGIGAHLDSVTEESLAALVIRGFLKSKGISPRDYYGASIMHHMDYPAFPIAPKGKNTTDPIVNRFRNSASRADKKLKGAIATIPQV